MLQIPAPRSVTGGQDIVQMADRMGLEDVGSRYGDAAQRGHSQRTVSIELL